MEEDNKKADKLDKVKSHLKNRNFIIKSLLIAFNVIFLAFALTQIYKFTSTYSVKGTNLFNDGKKIIVSVKTDEVEIAELSEDQLPEEMRSKTPDEQADEAEEVAEESEIKEEEEEEVAEEAGEAEEVTEQAQEETVKEVVPLDYSKANLSIIITEVGLKQKSLEEAKILPKEVSFAFSPYSDEIDQKIEVAKEQGREVLLNIMFEPSDYPLEDTGPLTIQSHFEQTQNIFRLQNTISKTDKVMGYLTNTDEVITHSLEVITPILNKIKEQQKFFAFYKQPVNAYLEKEVKPMAVDVAIISHMVDAKPGKTNVMKKLNEVKQELLGKQNKVVIALHPYPTSIATLKEWLDENLGPNIQIAPISYFITDN